MAKFKIDVLKLTIDSLEGMLNLHRGNIVHRDLKPENIVHRLNTHNEIEAALIDFGLSLSDQLLDPKESIEFGGTQYYLSPETSRILEDINTTRPANHPDGDSQALTVDEWKKKTLSHFKKSDYWAMGITLIYLTTGKLPNWSDER